MVSSLKNSAGSKVRPDIVLVDDNVLYLETAKELVEHGLKRTIHIASTPYQAREILHHLIGPAVFLVDYHMPKIKGLQLIKQLQDAAQFPIECVLVTAEENQSVFSESLRAGVFPFHKLVPGEGKKFNLGQFYLSMIEFAEVRLRKSIHQITDSLTGGYTWEGGMFMCQQAFGRAKREKISLALALFDLNDFKTVNDTFTHQAGDLLLQATGKAVRQGLRTTDIFFRRGDEMYILMEIEDTQTLDRDEEKRRVVHIAREVVERVESLIKDVTVEVVPGVRVAPSVAWGIEVLLRESLTDDPAHDLVELLMKPAEVYMYEHKVEHYKQAVTAGNKTARKKHKYYLKVAADKAAALKR